MAVGTYVTPHQGLYIPIPHSHQPGQGWGHCHPLRTPTLSISLSPGCRASTLVSASCCRRPWRVACDVFRASVHAAPLRFSPAIVFSKS